MKKGRPARTALFFQCARLVRDLSPITPFQSEKNNLNSRPRRPMRRDPDTSRLPRTPYRRSDNFQPGFHPGVWLVRLRRRRRTCRLECRCGFFLPGGTTWNTLEWGSIRTPQGSPQTGTACSSAPGRQRSAGAGAGLGLCSMCIPHIHRIRLRASS